MLRIKLLSALLLLVLVGIPATAQISFQDSFNRTDGPIDNGWLNWEGCGNPSVVSGGQLATYGCLYHAGGVYRSSLPFTFPLTFSFKFSTQAPLTTLVDGGWMLVLNAPDSVPNLGTAGQIKFLQYYGRDVIRRTVGPYSFQDTVMPTGAREFSTSPTTITGVIRADYSAYIRMVYPDGHIATASFPVPSSPFTPPPAPGSTLVLGNSNQTVGPHFFDNVYFGPASDIFPPTITDVSASPNVIWSPNKFMVPVTISVLATDESGAPSCAISDITSDEPGWNAAGDWEITGPLSMSLRSNRLGTQNGRVYTVKVTCSDAAGNSASASTTIDVPHDQGSSVPQSQKKK